MSLVTNEAKKHPGLKAFNYSKYLRNIILLQEKERKSVSWLIGEDIGNILIGLYLQISSLKNELCKKGITPDTCNMFIELTSMSNIIRRSINKVKVASDTFRPAGLDAVGLKGGMLDLVEKLKNETNTCWNVKSDKNINIDEPQRTVVFRLFQRISSKIKEIGGIENVEIGCNSKNPGKFLMNIKITGNGLTNTESFKNKIACDPEIYEYCDSFNGHINVYPVSGGFGIELDLPLV